MINSQLETNTSQSPNLDYGVDSIPVAINAVVSGTVSVLTSARSVAMD